MGVFLTISPIFQNQNEKRIEASQSYFVNKLSMQKSSLLAKQFFFTENGEKQLKKTPTLYLLMKRQLQLPFQLASGNDPIWAWCAIADAEQVWCSRNPHSSEGGPPDNYKLKYLNILNNY